ncbi:MAG: TetR/AcrR family transcriptional regulator [Anaerolineaceae bacterium]|nr:TetR/AcrR family transcriptional regulator [Anaerolineaceae bacterium]
MTKTLREERREETLQMIKNLAWQKMAENGPANLSLRAIARQMRVSSAAIYRYFENRDALLTELCKDAYYSQVAALQTLEPAAADENYSEHILKLSRLYRQWALQNPEKFALVYGAPVPGFRQSWEVLAPFASQIMDIFLEAFQAAWQHDQNEEHPDLPPIPDRLKQQLAHVIAQRKYNVPPAVLYLTLEGWTRLHGIISLELIDQLALLGDAEAFFEYQMQNLIRQSGFVQS